MYECNDTSGVKLTGDRNSLLAGPTGVRAWLTSLGREHHRRLLCPLAPGSLKAATPTIWKIQMQMKEHERLMSGRLKTILHAFVPQRGSGHSNQYLFTLNVRTPSWYHDE